MANVIKQVDRNIPSQMRTQTFTQADAAVSDVILVKDSLGKAASHLEITAVAAMSVRLNVRHVVYPRRGLNSGMADMGIVGPNVSDGREYLDRSQDPIAIGVGETLTLDQDVAVEDIEIVSAAGNFSILVS